MAIKNCAVCGGEFVAKASKKTCSTKCYSLRRNESSRQWSRDNPQKVREIQKRQYAKNPQRYAASNQRRRDKDPEKFRQKNLESTKRWQRLHPERYRAERQRWMANNPDKVRAQKQRHANKIAAAMLFIKQLQTMDSKVFL